MLRTLLGVVLISIVVTPVFAEANKILPKIYSQKDYDIISIPSELWIILFKKTKMKIYPKFSYTPLTPKPERSDVR
jgi:hypothetical protein